MYIQKLSWSPTIGSGVMAGQGERPYLPSMERISVRGRTSFSSTFSFIILLNICFLFIAVFLSLHSSVTLLSPVTPYLRTIERNRNSGAVDAKETSNNYLVIFILNHSLHRPLWLDVKVKSSPKAAKSCQKVSPYVFSFTSSAFSK